MRVVLDIEANGLIPSGVSQIFCIVTKDVDTDEVQVFDGEDMRERFSLFASKITEVIGHNIIEYDLRVLDHCGYWKCSANVTDTLILSRLLNVGRTGGHSLESWGLRLKFPKGNYNDFTKYTPEMLEYCKQDVELNAKVYLELRKVIDRNQPSFDRAIKLEHDIQRVCLDMHDNGFAFDRRSAEAIREELNERIRKLDLEIVRCFPPRTVRVQLKTKVKETIVEFNPNSPKQIIDALWEAGWKPVDKTKGAKKNEDPEKKAKFDKYGWTLNETNLSTLPDDAPEGLKVLVERRLLQARVNTLTEWVGCCETWIKIKKKEKENTDKSGLIETITAKSNELLIENGIILINEDVLIEGSKENLEFRSKIMKLWQLPKEIDASFAEKLRNSLSIIVTKQEMYVDCSALVAMLSSAGMNNVEVKPSNVILHRICGRFNPLGAVSHRCTHSNPNMGNIATKKTIKYNTPHLREAAIDLGGRMRSLWVCDNDSWLVGTDMESAHLRIFAHMIDDEKFTQSLISGKKEDGTDPHSVNKAVLGSACVDRDRSKTFIFSFLNGAAAPKVSEIFGCSLPIAKAALSKFVRAYPGLKKLKQEVFPRDAERGYFIGIDGRKIVCDSEHLMMGMYLQSTESILMKYANMLWRKKLDDEGIKYKQVNWVHDEWVTEIRGNRILAERVGQIQSDAIREVGSLFNLRCPMGGESKVGKNWLEVH